MRLKYKAYIGSALTSVLVIGICLTAFHTTQELDTEYASEIGRLNDLKSLIKKRDEDWNQTLTASKKSPHQYKSQDVIFKEYERFTQMRRELTHILQEETGTIQDRLYKSKSSYERSDRFIMLISVFTLALLWSGLFILVRNINHRQIATLKMKKAGETFQKLVSSSPVGILVMDLNLAVKIWNPACEKIFGWTPEEVMDKIPPIFSENEKPTETAKKLVHDMIDGRALVETQLETPNKHGAKIRFAASGIPIMDPGERIEGYMFTLSDITEKERIQNELRHAKDEALRASRTKSDFLAGMSHEIRTPLNGIVGMTDLLLETALDEQQRLYTKIVKDSSASLLDIVNDILDFSKIEAEKLELEQIDFSLVPLIESQADLMAPRAKEKNLTVMTYIDPKIPWNLVGDPGRLGQILLNFLGNSIKFTQSGSIVIRAELGQIENNHAQITFSVTDSGIGLSPEVQAKIFKPFTQADGSTARKFGGTGLGLSICKNLVERMGGKIGVISKADSGATFWFNLSLAISKESEKFAEYETGQISGKVLILAKETLEREVLSRYMKDWRFTYDDSATPKEAIQKLHQAVDEKSPYNVILVDKNLGELDGFAFAKEILADEKIAKAKMLLLTNFEKGTRLENAHLEGFTGYLTKPIKQLALFNLIQDALLRNRRELKIVGEIKKEARLTDLTTERLNQILVVEDNQVNQMLVTKFLKSLGYICQTVPNGKQAVEAVQKFQYDLILMDCHMPEMDGYEATVAIREIEKSTGRRVPIIALTASVMPADRQKALDSGMDDHLAKPIKKDQLHQMIERWTEKSVQAA